MEEEDRQEADERDPPHEKPVSLPFDDWKEALREFFRRQDEEVRPGRTGDDESGGE